jgi:hypothetical protein
MENQKKLLPVKKKRNLHAMVMYLVQCGGLGAKLKPACHSSGIFSIVDLWSDFFPKQKKNSDLILRRRFVFQLIVSKKLVVRTK